MDKKEIKDKLAAGWLHVHLIFEILGKPAEHIEKALGMLIEKLNKEKNLELLKKDIHKAKKVEKTKDVFTTFAEVELLVNGLPHLVEIIYDYMPSSIEITEPGSFVFKIEDANALLNDLAAKLHQYDAFSKKLRLEREILIKRLKELTGKKK